MENQGLQPIQQNSQIQLNVFEEQLIVLLGNHSLPTTGIFVGVPERHKVFKNLTEPIELINVGERSQSIYLSKFIAAVASGLFDAALNYLWDETINQIRKRVSQYDLEYFYDNAVNGEKRKKLKGEDDLVKLDDYELIKGAREIELISGMGFKHLEFINYMRNWASAAHPNQNDITGLQLVSWLETCIKEVISLPLSNVVTRIKQLLANIKTTTVSATEAQEIGLFFTGLNQDQCNSLVSGLFGIYTAADTDNKTLQNINKLLPLVWTRVDESVKYSFGLKYSYHAANNNQKEKTLARNFLQIVNAESYLPDDLRSLEIKDAVDDLLAVHRNRNNFYHEGAFAKQLNRIVGTPPKVPKSFEKRYVISLVEVFLTNGNGVTWEAEPIYKNLLSNLDSHQGNIAVLSFTNDQISSKLQFQLCKKKFLEMLEIVKPSITSPPVKELITKVETFKAGFDKLGDDKSIKTSLDNLRVLLS